MSSSGLLPSHNGRLLPILENQSIYVYGFELLDTARIHAVISSQEGSPFSLLRVLDNLKSSKESFSANQKQPEIVIAGKPLPESLVEKMSRFNLKKLTAVVNVFWLLDSVKTGALLPLDLERYQLQKFLEVKLFSGCVFTILQYGEMDENTLKMTKDLIIQSGGTISDHFDKAQTTHLVLQYATGPEYTEAMKAGITVATLHWVHDCYKDKVLSKPSDRILNAPFPIKPVPSANKMVVSVTGYSGQARMDIKDMIIVMGGSFTGTLSQDNTLLISTKEPSLKCEKAKEWGIPIVNHLWLHDTLLNWKAMSVKAEIYKDLEKVDVSEVGKITSKFAQEEEDRVYESQRTPAEQMLSGERSQQKRRRTDDDLPGPTLTPTSITITSPAPASALISAPVLLPPAPALLPLAPALIPLAPIPAPGSAPAPIVIPAEESESPKRKKQKNAEEPGAPKILFTGFQGKEAQSYEKKVIALGGTIAPSISSCTHLVTNKLIRTAKLLSGICLCEEIVRLDWILRSAEKGFFLDSKNFQLVDKEAERNYGFTLAESMRRAKKEKVLDKKAIFLDPAITQEKNTLHEIIVSAGGKVLPNLRLKEEGDELIVLATSKSKDWMQTLRKKYPDMKFYDQELLLAGILKQELDYAKYFIQLS